MQALLAPHPCQGACMLRPTCSTPHTKNVLTSSFIPKSMPTFSIATTPVRNLAHTQRNRICAMAVEDAVSGFINKMKGQKVDPSAPVWTTTIYTTGELAKNLPVLDFLDLELVSETGLVDAEKQGQDLAKWERKVWTSNDGRNLGETYFGTVRIGTNVGRPSIARFTHKGGSDNPASFYISRLVLTRSGEEDITFPVNSWIHAKHEGGKRIFFDSTPRLPSDTPKFLEQFRKKELETLRGPPKKAEKEPRNEWDRTYQYDVYNDLGDPRDASKVRPVLGGRKDPNKLAYPRRIRTGRGLYENGKSENPVSKEGEDYWLPQDEKFDPLKEANFARGRGFYKLYALNGILSAMAQDEEGTIVDKAKAVKQKAYTFADFEAYNSLFTDREGAVEKALDTIDSVADSVTNAVVGKLQPSLGQGKLGSLIAGVSSNMTKWDNFVDNAKKGTFNVSGELEETIAKAKIAVDKLTFSPPFVFADRKEAWQSDEEWGRETLAGQNPCVITAISKLPEGTTITAKHLEAGMGGVTLAEAFAAPKPRVFLIDYAVIYPEYTKLINADKDRFQYAGRAVLFLRDDGYLVPVAIELFTGETEPVVYTPSDPPNVWLVAKHVFSSVDSGFHQVYSHFCRTHAVVEPACIAIRRQLSALHPVYKLMMPHFRFTLNINKNARQTLVSQGGIIESTFTPGKYAMTLSAEVYGNVWRFSEQALPNDLIKRGMAKKGADGKTEVLLPDYPYAHDGLLVWEGMMTWVRDYLSLYYTGEPGKTVADDPEINAWWNEFRLEGHPDVTVGWPKMETVDDLTEILVTIIWLASAHHAAVNFGQYDYSAYMPNRSSVVHKPIPAKGTPEYKSLSQNLDKNFFKIFARTTEAVQVMATVALLSTHAENEQYINDKEHFYIFDKEARKLYDAHVKRFKDIEAEIGKRNSKTDSPVRSPAKGGLPYKLLLPSSEAGITGQGIPNSVSI